MMRKSIKMLLVALAAVMMLGSVGEAAPVKRVVKHRTRHTSRVTSGVGTTGTATAKKKKTTRKRAAQSSSKRSTARRQPTTKPR